MNYELIIGLEIHIELATKSKMFCACSAEYFGAKPNTHTCPVCLGLPGALPYANGQAIEFAQKFGLALSCEVLLSSKFDRKNYFYPDLPKGFQISQYQQPFSKKGSVVIPIDPESNNVAHPWGEPGRDFAHPGGVKPGFKTIGITRAHLEEDTGKLTHAVVNGKKVTLIDFNRSSVPLLEIVSEPEIASAYEAKAYAQKLHQIVRYLGISDADMEKGSMRIEPNISLRKKGALGLPNYKVELKNINSFRFVERAINFECKRQSKLLDEGKTPTQETRGWNETKNITFSQRSKEEAHDYRYFPEPDLPPFLFMEDAMFALKASQPELPDEKRERFVKDFGLSEYDVEILTRDSSIADYVEESIKTGRSHSVTPKQIANYIINKKPDLTQVLPAELIQNLKSSNQVSGIEAGELGRIVNEVIEQNPQAVDSYKKGKENTSQFLLGQVMRASQGKADPKETMKLIQEKLNK